MAGGMLTIEDIVAEDLDWEVVEGEEEAETEPMETECDGALMDGSVFSMTGPWDSDRDRVQRDFGFRFDFEARGRANFEASVQAPGRL